MIQSWDRSTWRMLCSLFPIIQAPDCARKTTISYSTRFQWLTGNVKESSFILLIRRNYICVTQALSWSFKPQNYVTQKIGAQKLFLLQFFNPKFVSTRNVPQTSSTAYFSWTNVLSFETESETQKIKLASVVIEVPTNWRGLRVKFRVFPVRKL